MQGTHSPSAKTNLCLPSSTMIALCNEHNFELFQTKKRDGITRYDIMTPAKKETEPGITKCNAVITELLKSNEVPHEDWVWKKSAIDPVWVLKTKNEKDGYVIRVHLAGNTLQSIFAKEYNFDSSSEGKFVGINILKVLTPKEMELHPIASGDAIDVVPIGSGNLLVGAYGNGLIHPLLQNKDGDLVVATQYRHDPKRKIWVRH